MHLSLFVNQFIFCILLTIVLLRRSSKQEIPQEIGFKVR